MLTKKEIKVMELRKKKLTQVEVARRLHITQAAVSNFEKRAYSKIKDADNVLSKAKLLKLL